MSIKQAIEALELAIETSYSDYTNVKFKAAIAALRSMPQGEPYAYAVYFPDQPTEELVHDLDELLDDMTNREHTITELFATPHTEAKPAKADALNTICKMLHSGEEVEGDDGLAMLVPMDLWNEAQEAIELLVGEDDATEAKPAQDAVDAERYRLLRRGQHWSVIDGIGNVLRGDDLDAAINAKKG